MLNNDQVLLVEGKDDKHVVLQICKRHKMIPEFCILDKEEDGAGSGGISLFLEDIGPEILAPGRKAVGILVDANEDLTARWNAVAHRLREEHIEVPNSPEEGGTILECSPRVGIWLMPDNSSSGELEDFVSGMIPDEDPVWPLAQDYIDGIPEEDRKFTEKKSQRAKLHAWLATREDPRPMGLAIRAGDLKVDGNLSTTFAEWLRKLFKCDEPTE